MLTILFSLANLIQLSTRLWFLYYGVGAKILKGAN